MRVLRLPPDLSTLPFLKHPAYQPLVPTPVGIECLTAFQWCIFLVAHRKRSHFVAGRIFHITDAMLDEPLHVGVNHVAIIPMPLSVTSNLLFVFLLTISSLRHQVYAFK
jgi:hypothetical protein